MTIDYRAMGYAKRFMESFDILPGFCELFSDEPYVALDSIGIPYRPEELQYILTDNGICARYPGTIIDNFLTQWNDVYRSIEHDMHHRSIAQNKKLTSWQNKIKEKNKAEKLGDKMYIPMAFELTQGCSVGCDFCGFCSKRLTGIYESNAYNIKLFEKILDVSMTMIGSAAGHGILYYATEPLDNPHYEDFANIVLERTGVLPQITTAVPLRNTERMKKILYQLNNNPRTVYRFSVRSFEDFFEIYNTFAPEELLYVIMLSRFPECGTFIPAGRRGIATKEYNETIACVAGFVVNMVSKTISMRYPCHADELHPTGEVILRTDTFRDAVEYGDKLNEMIDKLDTYIDTPIQ